MGKDGATLQLPDITFGINQDLPQLDSGWQKFPGHYLLYAALGTFNLEVNDCQWLLPPQRAAWVRADAPIRIYSRMPVTSSSILFARDSIPTLPFECRVFNVSVLAREMILYAMRWDIQREPENKTADQFFGAVAGVCLELAANSDRFWLPRPRSNELSDAMRYILEHLSSRLLIDEVAQVIHLSSRTLARRFVKETHMTFGKFIHHARMLRAMEHLGNSRNSITDIAYLVGFESISAFNAAFRKFTQETPSQYRKRFMSQ